MPTRRSNVLRTVATAVTTTAAPTTARAAAAPDGQLTVWGAAFYRTNRVLWMLEEMGLPYTHRPVDIRQGTPEDIAELTALNPRAKIPALQDGSFVLAESAAIISYLADNYGDGSFIPPPRTPDRATHDMWMFYCAASPCRMLAAICSPCFRRLPACVPWLCLTARSTDRLLCSDVRGRCTVLVHSPQACWVEAHLR